MQYAPTEQQKTSRACVRFRLWGIFIVELGILCVKFLLRVVPSLKRRGSEENDRQRFPRVQIRVSSCLSCVNSLLLTLAEVAVAVPPFVFGRPLRSPLALTERAAGESEGIPTLTLP